MRLLALLIGLLGAALAPSRVSADEPPQPQPPAQLGTGKCAAPAELLRDDPQLPKISAQLRQHEPVVIVVVGGASTAGTSPDSSYPYFLQAALRRRHPGETITVINKGVAGQTTDQMAVRFPKDVYPDNPSLVIWETGTVDAVRSEDVDGMAEALTNGLTDIQSHGAEAMLVDMQYNPSTVSVINFEPYLDALHQTADQQNVYLFKRYDLMKYWIDAGEFDFINVPREKRLPLAREFYACLGERLADAIDYAAR
ncbi:MAG TPA: GDSL-type esterase/lipase family protein [Stellaceae bacterium]|nr:GDSL-type esterase/lipase family protein [Stellaceae bacterium]